MELLIADDDAATRLALQLALAQRGYEVMVASSGTEAWQLWEERRPQMVISDWNMPGMTGEELCRSIRQSASERLTYVVIVTGETARATAIAELEAGADDYIQKPFDTRELVLRVKAGARIVALEDRLAGKIAELEGALARINTLEGLLPTCCYCRKVKDEAGEWRDLEVYIRRSTRANFSHGYCPECYEKHVLPQLADDSEG